MSDPPGPPVTEHPADRPADVAPARTEGARPPLRGRSVGHRWHALAPLAPLAAVGVTALVGARALRSTPLADDGALTAPAWVWLQGGPTPTPLTPEGLGTWHTGAWAALTRAFDRYDGLAAAGRELLWTALVVSSLLLWLVARRAGLGNAATTVAVLVFGAVPGLVLLHAVSSPAALAVPWLLLSARLALARSRGAAVVAAVAVVPAVLLAPDVALLLVAGLAAALASGRVARGRSASVRVVVAALLAPVFVGLVLLLPRWDPQPDVTAPWAAGETRSVLLTAGLLAAGALAAWVLPRWRPPAAALAVTTLAAVAPPGRFSALVVCLPLAALLLGALVERLLAEPVPTRARPGLAVLGGAGLAAALVLAAVALPRSPDDDFGAADRADLVAWLGDQVPADTPVAATGLLAVDLQRAGVPIGDGGLRVTRGVGSGEPGGEDDPDVIARFGEDGDTALVVADPRLVPPTAEQAELRRQLAAALLTNPTTADTGQATGALLSGDVDPRLLTLLAGIASQYGVGLFSLPTVPGEVGTTIREAVVDTVGGIRLSDDPALVARVRTWLDAQLAPYAPNRVEPVADGLLIGFDHIPDPDQVVTRASG